jgi:hypothetical protein
LMASSPLKPSPPRVSYPHGEVCRLGSFNVTKFAPDKALKLITWAA